MDICPTVNPETQTAESKGRFSKEMADNVCSSCCLSHFLSEEEASCLTKQEKTDTENSDPCYIV